MNLEKAKKNLEIAKARFQNAAAAEKRKARENRNHGLYCLAGALLKHQPQVAHDLLNILKMTADAPTGHAAAIEYILENKSENAS